jgi:NADP-dependent 3-hydroxy acid dehydrogenase YdfG
MVLTNVLGVAYTIRATLPHMRERTGGHYVLTSSVAGRRALPGSLYSSTKWAVTGMAESLRQELRQSESEVRVTVIEPGMVDTAFFSRRPPDALDADDIARIVLFALDQPPRVDINEVLVRPARQAN